MQVFYTYFFGNGPLHLITDIKKLRNKIIIFFFFLLYWDENERGSATIMGNVYCFCCRYAYRLLSLRVPTSNLVHRTYFHPYFFYHRDHRWCIRYCYSTRQNNLFSISISTYQHLFEYKNTNIYSNGPYLSQLVIVFAFVFAWIEKSSGL